MVLATVRHAAGVIVVATFRIPPSGVRAFREYEDAILPLLSEHGGTLERRLSNADGTVEVHVLSFDSRTAYDAFSRDPRRTPRRSLLAAAGIRTDVFEDLAEV
jgi:hypothetical protein